MPNLLTAPLAAMPERMIAGDTLKVDFAGLANDYPVAAGNAVAVLFVPIAGGTPESIAASDGSDQWSLIVPAATSDGWVPGLYRWAVRVTNGGEKVTANSGTIYVDPDPADTSVDARSHARKVLDALDATIEGRASQTDLETTFDDGRAIKRLSHKELVDMRKIYAGKVSAEERSAKGQGFGRIVTRL